MHIKYGFTCKMMCVFGMERKYPTIPYPKFTISSSEKMKILSGQQHPHCKILISMS